MTNSESVRPSPPSQLFHLPARGCEPASEARRFGLDAPPANTPVSQSANLSTRGTPHPQTLRADRHSPAKLADSPTQAFPPNSCPAQDAQDPLCRAEQDTHPLDSASGPASETTTPRGTESPLLPSANGSRTSLDSFAPQIPTVRNDLLDLSTKLTVS